MKHKCDKCGAPAPFGLPGDVWLCREHWEQTADRQARIAKAIALATGE